jgi:hypothetical protein
VFIDKPAWLCNVHKKKKALSSHVTAAPVSGYCMLYHLPGYPARYRITSPGLGEHI